MGARKRKDKEGKESAQTNCLNSRSIAELRREDHSSVTRPANRSREFK